MEGKGRYDNALAVMGNGHWILLLDGSKAALCINKFRFQLIDDLVEHCSCAHGRLLSSPENQWAANSPGLNRLHKWSSTNLDSLSVSLSPWASRQLVTAPECRGFQPTQPYSGRTSASITCANRPTLSSALKSSIRPAEQGQATRGAGNISTGWWRRGEL